MVSDARRKQWHKRSRQASKKSPNSVTTMKAGILFSTIVLSTISTVVFLLCPSHVEANAAFLPTGFNEMKQQCGTLQQQQHRHGLSSPSISLQTEEHYSLRPTRANTNLYGSPSQDDGKARRTRSYGLERGLVIQTIVVAFCVWLFSIPPEFRRAYFCSTTYCEQNRSQCHNCVTTAEWSAGVAEYYKNGGGIEFDFTVADETKQFWQGK